MSATSQVSALAAAVGAKLKLVAPITKHKLELFGLYPYASSALQNILGGNNYYFGTVTYGTDSTATTTPGSTSTWSLVGHWSGTYTLVVYYCKLTNTGLLNIELSKDGGVTWTTLATSVDTYNATALAGALFFTGIAIPEGSNLLIRFTVVGKNPSSSQYFYTVSGWELNRTGA